MGRPKNVFSKPLPLPSACCAAAFTKNSRILSIVDCHYIACYLLNVISVSTEVNRILGWFRPREVLEKLSHTYPGLSVTSGMPLYSQLIIALPGIPKPDLVALCRTHAKLVIDFGGVVRGIENHGVRPLPARAKRQYPTEQGERYFEEARFITATFDASPKLLNDVERLLRADEGVLRFYTTRTRNNVAKVRGSSFRNRYLHVAPEVPTFPV